MRLTRPVRGDEHEIRVVFVQARVEHRDKSLAFAELEEILGGGQPLLRQVVHRRPVRAPAVGEEQQARERRRLEDLRDGVALARARDQGLARPFRHRPHVAPRGHRHHVRVVLDERTDVDVARVVADDLGAARRACARRGWS